jgi:hypothetical protein
MCGKSGRYVITVKDIRGLDGLPQWHWANFNSDPGNSGAEDDFFSLELRYHVAGDLSKNATKIIVL